MFINHNNLQCFIHIKSLSLNKFIRSKNYQNMTFKLIIVKVKLIKLVISYHNILSKMLKK